MKEKDSQISLPSSSSCWILGVLCSWLDMCLMADLGVFEVLNLLRFLSATGLINVGISQVEFAWKDEEEEVQMEGDMLSSLLQVLLNLDDCHFLDVLLQWWRGKWWVMAGLSLSSLHGIILGVKDGVQV